MGDVSGVRLKGGNPAAALPQVLADRGELAFVAMEMTRMAMTITNPRLADNPIVLANQAFLDLTGYTSDEILGRNCRFLQGPDTAPAALQAIRDAIADQNGITLDLLNYRKDGSAFWNDLKICPVLDTNGELLYYFASQSDVGERRRVQDLEAAEHGLLREIEHRARNALALVQGIVRMSQADTVEHFASLVQGRVDALSNAQTMLALGRWQDVPLGRLLEAEISAFGAKNVVMAGPGIDILAAQVEPLALVLHEVMDNAIRHGSLSTSAGAMSVRWRAEADRTVIELDETGGPTPSAVRRAGFGTRIITAIVERQLRGSVDFHWQPSGLRSVLRVPTRAPS